MSDKPNPLFPHAIVVIVVGVVLVAVGAWGTLKNVRGLKDAARLEGQVKSSKGMAAAPNMKAPTSLSGAASQAAALKQKARQIKKILSVGWMVLLGGGLIFAGVKIIKQANWARYLGFGGVAFGVLYFATFEGVRAVTQSSKTLAIHTSWGLPIVLVVVVAGLAGKPLFDLITEKFE